MALAKPAASARRGRGGVQDLDREVAARLRQRRVEMGLTQQQLAELIGVTYQQAHKYERGLNRISAGRLFEIAQVLDVPVSFFFDDTDPVRAPAMGGFAEPPAEAFEADPLHKEERIELVRAYFAIEDATVRRRLLDLAKALAAESDATAEKPPPRAVATSR